MGLDFEILENEYNKIAADKAEVEARTDLTDEEKQTTLAGFDRALEGLEGGIVTLATKTKQDMQAIIADLEKKVAVNEDYIKSAEEEIAKRTAEIEEEMAKENPDKGAIEAKQAEIKALEKRVKSLKSATKKVQKEIKEQNKLLIPLMKRFGDKIFTAEEIADLEKLDKKIQSGKALADKMKNKEQPAEEQPVEEQPAEEQPVEEQPAEEQPVEEQPAEEQPAEEQPAEEQPVAGAAFVSANNVTEPEVVEEEQKKSPEEEFKELYKKAKRRELSQEDFDKLVGIMSKPENYDKLGITTGVLRNKSKVILKAMGEYATTNIYKSVSDSKEYFGIEVNSESEQIIPTDGAYYWRGITTMAENADIKLASQDVLERVVIKASEIGIDNLDDMQRQTVEKATKHLINIYGFEDSIAAYSSVKSRRREALEKWFGLKKSPIALDESKEEIAEEVPDTNKSYEFKEEEFSWEYTDGEYIEPKDTFTSKLQDSVVPPEEVKEVEKTEKVEPEIEEDVIE